MARVTENGFSGTIGNLVFYTVDGVNYVRTKPGKRNKKRNKKPDRNTSTFGIVSKYGTPMIKWLKGSFLFSFKRTTYNDARSWMINQYAVNQDSNIWELSSLDSGMCQLNRQADLRDLLKISLPVSDMGEGVIKVLIPEMNPVKHFRAPLRTTKINMRFVAVCSAFQGLSPHINFYREDYCIDYINDALPPAEITLNTNHKGSVAIVAVALQYEQAANVGFISDPKWLPAALTAMGRLKA